jgi:hypothetical protein
MNSKRGGALGSSLSTVVAIIAVIGILVVFIFASSFVKLVSDVKGGTKIYDGSMVGLGDVFHYQAEYLKLVGLRILAYQDKPISQDTGGVDGK